MTRRRGVLQSTQTLVKLNLFYIEDIHILYAIPEIRSQDLIERKLVRHKNGTNLKHIHTQSHTVDERFNKTQWVANVPPNSIPLGCLKPRATNLDLASTTYLCLSVFHVNIHFPSIVFVAELPARRYQPTVDIQTPGPSIVTQRLHGGAS